MYAEVEEGAVSADLFYIQSVNEPIRFRFCSPNMKNLIVALWEKWQSIPGNRDWRVMCFLIDGGRFNIDLTYPDQIDKDEDLSDRRPLAVQKYFGDIPVDCSNRR